MKNTRKKLPLKQRLRTAGQKATVKFRITSLFSCLLSLVFLVITIIVFICTDEFSMGFAIDQVEEAVRSIKTGLNATVVDETVDISFNPQRKSDVDIIVFDDDGNILYSEHYFPTMTDMPDMDCDTNTFQDENGISRLTYDEHTTLEGVGNVWVRGVISTAQSRSTISTFILTTLCALPVIVIIVAFLGYFFIGRAFSPVNEIRESAEKIAESGDMSRKIKIGRMSTNPRDEVTRLKHTFDEMLNRLNASAERDKQFTSDVSHELKTPVAVIISQCETYLEHGNPDEAAKKAVTSIYEEAQSMSYMIRQLLMLAKADSGSQVLCFEKIDICGIADAVCDQLSEAASRKRICLHRSYSGEIFVTADEMLIMRLFINLIQNSINYGKTDGNIWVRIEADTVCTITVTDDGIGIEPEALPRIFDRFYHSDSSHSGQGSGLGLSIVKWIVSAHNGHISVNSQLGNFSEFSVTIPIEQSKLS